MHNTHLTQQQNFTYGALIHKLRKENCRLWACTTMCRAFS